MPTADCWNNYSDGGDDDDDDDEKTTREPDYQFSMNKLCYADRLAGCFVSAIAKRKTQWVDIRHSFSYTGFKSISRVKLKHCCLTHYTARVHWRKQ